MTPQVREMARNAEDWMRGLTATIRLQPVFLVIGGQRCGTTSLYDDLARHPAVARARRKEIHYFDREIARGPAWYFGQFPLRRPQDPRITGEASPYYLFDARVPARVASLLPDVKLVALLRNPADRAISQFHHERRKGRESASLEDALRFEPTRLAAAGKGEARFDTVAYRAHSYVARGRYAEQLERWLALFPREQIFVAASEEFFADPDSVFGRLTDFLGLPPWRPASFAKLNGGRTEASDGVREELVEAFRPHNRRLYDLLGRDLGWDAA